MWHDTQKPESRTEIAKLDSSMCLSSLLLQEMMTVHKICFLHCCSNLTHKQQHHVWVQNNVRLEKPRISFHLFIEREVKVFQMFRALPYIKLHPVPGSLLPPGGKGVRSKLLPCLSLNTTETDLKI